jgi:hypothetical protein
VRSGQVLPRAVAHAGLVAVVDGCVLAVQPGEQPSRLPVGVRVVLGRIAFDEHTRQVAGDQHLRLVVGVHEFGYAPVQRTEPLAVGA